MFLAIHSCKNSMDETKEILEVLDSGKKSWNSGDIEGYMSTYLKSDTLIFVGGSKLQKGWDQTLDNYMKAYPSKESMGELEYGSLRVEMQTSEKATVTGTWKLLGLETTPSGYFTLLLVKTPAGWKIYRDHTS